MSVLAKITAIIIFVIGLLVMLSGIGAGVTGAARMGMQSFNQFPGGPMMPGITPAMGLGFSLVLGGIIFIQGLFLAAAGEALYLIANIAQNTFARSG